MRPWYEARVTVLETIKRISYSRLRLGTKRPPEPTGNLERKSNWGLYFLLLAALRQTSPSHLEVRDAGRKRFYCATLKTLIWFQSYLMVVSVGFFASRYPWNSKRYKFRQ